MNILLTANSRYLCARKRVIYALREHTRQPVRVYLLYNQMSAQDLDDLREYAKNKCSVSLVGYHVKEDFFESLLMEEHFSPIIYYRLIAQKLLPDTVSRILYLDVDVMVNGNIDSFYSTDFQGNGIVACENFDDSSEYKERLGLKKTSHYVNAGVILFNMDYVRKMVPEDAVIGCIRKYSGIMKWYDQDILNILYEDSMICCRDRRYNFQMGCSPDKMQGLKEGLENAKIIHFTGSLKPWMKGYMGKAGGRYYKLLWRSGSKGKAVELGVYNMLRRWYWRVTGK